MTKLEIELRELLKKYEMDITEISILFSAIRNKHKLVIAFEDFGGKDEHDANYVCGRIN